MKTNHILAILAISALTGCATVSPADSKSTEGNLELNITTSKEFGADDAKIYVDNIFIGNISKHRPVLFLKNGLHTIKVEKDGTSTYEQQVTILGEPNHQVLNIKLTSKQ